MKKMNQLTHPIFFSIYLLACGHFRILTGKFPNLIPLMESNQEAALHELGTVDESEQRRMERYSAQDEENELHEVMDIIETY